ncbi:oligosaccharyltransferase complex subunit epsilon [Friedmanniomyces endolithicus]|uniref:Dolichyl-diphosphooligosaccharide--protein glycosyltransferase subunit OST2 n=1 Tax=Friedmanniomyces endolithicus TaxID=329885 RepID=A0AAN6QX68_9PEZI|nr:oligosaccharyltransferase complex subunit epsilon [Friedmanniomyces endolithicus]KAK0789105.1 oligosaccharyltransferase complex subunit epsilon [Friedmanniomyces endolithicus]KAK0799080.1 oligosaccharyltransferase complex subunit epsilon [Friedmanniomyces endolithicus]KAK0842506.1 oligosaccharyltransferase complex subunit epsilon [Friedmanniomyces endolithicus]KAK0912441.1 oligosaccharyltransferase complex subunit epsilon [Friedmanniomyces endolithicus]
MAPKNSTPSPAAALPSANRSQHTSASATHPKPATSHSKTQPQTTTPPTSSSTTAPKLAQQINALTNTKTATALSKSAPRSVQEAQQILAEMWNSYVDKTAQRVKLLDTFMGFLVLVGVLQFVYCVIVGNYPFNAFLAGFSATVGQFVLTASLRMQTNPENEKEFRGTSDERAFADFVFGSMILHFFCVNFIN